MVSVPVPGPQAMFQGDLQAVGDKCNEDVGIDIVATIDGQDIVVEDYIKTYKGEREYNHCSH